MDSEMKTEDKLKLVSLWFRWIITILIVIVLCIKFIMLDIDISKIQFSFSDLLSILLAFFAIWISINFYHKNNETANNFYDNTYRFTKDISGTLVRIEERFAEKLESLKEENKSLSGRIDKYYTNGSHSELDNEKDIKKEKEVEDKLQKELEEQKELVNNFSQKYQVAEADKEQFLRELEAKNDEINKLNRKMKLFQLSNEAPINDLDDEFNIPLRIISFFKRNVLADKRLYSAFFSLDNQTLRRNFYDLYRTSNLSNRFLIDLEKYDLMDENKILTEKGLHVFTSIIKNMKL